MSTLRSYILFTLLLQLLIGCQSIPVLRRNIASDYLVVVDTFDKADDFVELLRANGIPSEVYDPTDYGLADRKDGPSPDDSKAIWIGKNVPLAVVRKTLVEALEMFPFLCYVSIPGDRGEKPPERIQNEIFIGGATETALEEKLAVMPREEIMESLDKARSIIDFHRYIREKNR